MLIPANHEHALSLVLWLYQAETGVPAAQIVATYRGPSAYRQACETSRRWNARVVAEDGAFPPGSRFEVCSPRTFAPTLEAIEWVALDAYRRRIRRAGA